MSLQKQLVHLNMSGGLQKKDDQFLVIPSKLAAADNVEFDDLSTVIRRGGQSQVDLTPLTYFSSFTAGTAARVFSHNGVPYLEGIGSGLSGGVRRVQKGGGTLPVLNPNKVSGFQSPFHFRRAGMVTERVGGVDRKGTAYGSGIPIYDGSYDCASIGNVTCYVYETRDVNGSGRQCIRIVIVDDSTGFRRFDFLLATAQVLVRPRVVANNDNFFIYYGAFTSGLSTFDINVVSATPAGFLGSSSTVVAGCVTAGTTESTNNNILFDVAFSSDLSRLGLVVLYNNSVLEILYADLDTSNGSTTLDSNSTAPSVRPRSLTALYSLNASSEYVLHAFYSINTNVAKGANYNFTAATSTAETTVGTGAVGSIVGRIAAHELSSSQIYVIYDSLVVAGALNLYDSTLRLSRCSHTYTSLTECASMKSWFIGGRVASVNSRLYLPMVFVSSAFQGTTFVIDLTDALGNLGIAGAEGAPPYAVARIDYGEGALDYNRWQFYSRVPSAPVRSNTVIVPYLKYETDLRQAGEGVDTPFALSVAKIDFDSQLESVEVNSTTFLAGACPHIFDGSNYVEENFHHAPEFAAAPVAVAGGTYTFPTGVAATYTVCFTWGWSDAQGNWHESAPSKEFSITTTALNYTFTPVLINPPSLKANAQLLLYRSKGSSTDTSLYLATRSDGTQVATDAELGNGEQLYTAGGVLPNTPAPACRHVSVFQARLVLAGCGSGYTLHWSKPSQAGYGVEFSSGDPTHQTRVPSDRGRAVGAKEMDDKLVILCEKGAGIIYGTGPAVTGTQGAYSDFSTIVTEVGCSWDSPKSIVRGPEGVWFRSPFGIRLVSRGGALAIGQDGKQVGAEVDPLVSGNVIAVTGNAKQQVRFYQTNGTCLVWDYQWRQWTRFTGMACVDAVFADGRYYHVSNVGSSPLLRYTDTTAYVDVNDSGTANSTFSSAIETPWLSFAGIQGFQRIYRLMVLGRVAEGTSQPQRFSGLFAYNFDETTLSTVAVSAAVTPGFGGLVQFQHHFPQQKCESIKIRIQWRPDTGNTGRFRLTDLTLQVGVKSGYFKLPSSARY